MNPKIFKDASIDVVDTQESERKLINSTRGNTSFKAKQSIQQKPIFLKKRKVAQTPLFDRGFVNHSIQREKIKNASMSKKLAQNMFKRNPRNTEQQSNQRLKSACNTNFFSPRQKIAKLN